MRDLGIFGQELKKKNCHVWNQHLGTKCAWFGYFWTGIWKQFCHIWNQHPQICQTAKFLWKTKMPKFGTNDAFLGYFGPKMLYMSIFGLEF